MTVPPGVSFPNRRFVVTRLDAGTGEETIVIQSTALANNYTTDTSVRPGMVQNARNFIEQNPGSYLIYGPCSGAYYADSDRIWDSRVCDPL